MFKNPLVGKILQALAVAAFGFILLNLTFIFDFLFQSLVAGLIGLFTSASFIWLPPAMHGLFMVIIGLLSRLVFRSKLGTLYKAIFLPVPLAVVLVTMGMFLSERESAAYLPYLLGGLFSTTILYYLYRTRQPWLYYYATVLVGLALLLVGLLGVEI